MTVPEFAARVGISPKSAYKLIADRGIEYLAHPHGPIQITEEALAAYLERIRVPARPSGRPRYVPAPTPVSLHDALLERSRLEATETLNKRRRAR